MVIKPKLKKIFVSPHPTVLRKRCTWKYFYMIQKIRCSTWTEKKSPSLPTLGEMEGQVQEKNIFLKVA